MKVEKFTRTNEAFMSLLTYWWLERTGKPMLRELLSDYGFMAVDEDGTPRAAMFFFPTMGTEVAFVGWPISPRSTIREERDLALPLLFTEIHKLAKGLGYIFLTSYASTPGVNARLKEQGYLLGDENVNQYYICLGGK